MARKFVTDAKINLKKDVVDKRDRLFKNARNLLSETPDNLPSKIDREKEMSPIKDQGKLGSCVAFAITALKEWQEQQEVIEEAAEINQQPKRRFYDLSEQWVYYMAKKIDPWPNEEGTSIRYGMKVLNKIGVPMEDGWEYNDQVKGKPENWAHLVARWNVIKSYRRINNLDELKTALTLSPVAIGIELFEEFFLVDTDGIVRWPAQSWKSYGGHALCAIGFDDEKELIKIKNSWGLGWGKNGYGFVSYNYINTYMWDAWAAEDIHVTKSMLKGTKKLIE